MKSIIINTNKKSIEKAFKNPYEMLINDESKIREAVAGYVRKLVYNLHHKK